MIVAIGRSLVLDQCYVEAGARQQFGHGDERQRHSHEAEIVRREQSNQDQYADNPKAALAELEQHHPGGTAAHSLFSAGWHAQSGLDVRSLSI